MVKPVGAKKKQRGDSKFSHGIEHYYTLNGKRLHLCSIEELKTEAARLEALSIQHFADDSMTGIIPPSFRKKFAEAMENGMPGTLALHFYPREYGLVKGALRTKIIKHVKHNKIGEWK